MEDKVPAKADIVVELTEEQLAEVGGGSSNTGYMPMN